MKEKEYYTIGEVSKILNLDQHVVRFWGDKFSKYIKPVRKAGLRRYYTKRDLDILHTIKNLLYTKKFSIKGALLFLEENNILSNDIPLNTKQNFDSVKLDEIINSLEKIRDKLKQ